jgi:hypothetical protein
LFRRHIPLLGDFAIEVAGARHGPRNWRIDPSSAGPSRPHLSRSGVDSRPRHPHPRETGPILFGYYLSAVAIKPSANASRMAKRRAAASKKSALCLARLAQNSATTRSRHDAKMITMTLEQMHYNEIVGRSAFNQKLLSGDRPSKSLDPVDVIVNRSYAAHIFGDDVWSFCIQAKTLRAIWLSPSLGLAGSPSPLTLNRLLPPLFSHVTTSWASPADAVTWFSCTLTLISVRC